MHDYQEFLDSIDRKAYHEGEWQWEEDGYTVTRTYSYSAPGCHDSCGVLYYTKDGKLEKVEGDPLDPCANGKLCMRCLDLDEAANYPERPKYPMKRAGERGENKWERISWDEAFVLIEEYLAKLEADGYGRESIFVNHGTGRNISSWVPFLGGAVLGTPNIGAIGSSGYSCYLPRTCGTAASIGDFPIVDASETRELRYADPEWVRPDVLVIWGCEPLKSNADGFLGHWLVNCVQRGSKIISIDPQLTWWGVRAEYWLPIRPASDLALALAWLNVITTEDLIDHDFVEYWCAYYDELKEYVAQFTPEWAAGICEVPAEDIVASARFYANAERAGVQWGLAFDTQVDSIQLCMTVADLMAVCGNIDKPGTNVLVRNGFDINPGYATSQLYCDPETFAKKLTIDKIHPGYIQFIGMADCDAMGMAMETGKPYPLKMAWIQGSNSIACSSNASNRAYNNLSGFEFVVVADPFMTPTAVAFADVFLPLKMTNERDSMRVWWTPLRAMKAVTDYYEAKSDEELIVALGNRLNPELFNRRWPTVEALLQDYLDVGFNIIDDEGRCFKSAGRSKAGMVEVPDVHTEYYKLHKDDGGGSFMGLVENGGYEYDPFCASYKKYEKGMLRPDGLPGFATPSGRIELIP
ncbi:MAG: molybdopterin-dependent oxidoreductase, partial [Actinobacteria bacterium]|nr:molybdopterin-dependent oxidoreductase [Actinomycetota bacterium]